LIPTSGLTKDCLRGRVACIVRPKSRRARESGHVGVGKVVTVIGATTEIETSASSSRRLPVGFWILLLAGAALRMVRLENHSLWWDEAWQYHVATASTLPELFERLLHPGITLNPPLSHLVSFVFMRFGDSDALLRAP